MIVNSVICLHKLIAHDPIVFSVSGPYLHFAWVKKKVALASALVFHVDLSREGDGLALTEVFGVSKDLQFQGWKSVIILASTLRSVSLSSTLFVV